MMLSKKITKLITISSVTAMLLPSLATIRTVSANEDATTLETEFVENIGETITISNQDLFDAIEASGDNVEDYFSKEEINQALEEDRMNKNTYQNELDSDIIPAAVNGITGVTIVNSDTINLHLNSLVTKMLIASGAAVTGAYLIKIPVIANALKNMGIATNGLVAALGVVLSEAQDYANDGVTITLRRTWVGSNPTLTVLGVYKQP